MEFAFILLNNVEYVACREIEYSHLKYSFAAVFDSAPEATAAIPTDTPSPNPSYGHCSSRQPNHEFSAFRFVD